MQHRRRPLWLGQLQDWGLQGPPLLEPQRLAEPLPPRAQESERQKRKQVVQQWLWAAQKQSAGFLQPSPSRRAVRQPAPRQAWLPELRLVAEEGANMRPPVVCWLQEIPRRSRLAPSLHCRKQNAAPSRRPGCAGQMAQRRVKKAGSELSRPCRGPEVRGSPHPQPVRASCACRAAQPRRPTARSSLYSAPMRRPDSWCPLQEGPVRTQVGWRQDTRLPPELPGRSADCVGHRDRVGA